MEAEEQCMEEMTTQTCTENEEYICSENEKQEVEAEGQDKEEMTQRCIRDKECFDAERQEEKSKEQNKEVTQIYVKDKECFDDRERQEEESTEQDKEGIIQIYMKNEECFDVERQEESTEQDKEEMTQIKMKNKECFDGERQEEESKDQRKEEITQIKMKNKECFDDGEEESKEQDKEEMIQTYMKDKECFDGERQEEESKEQHEEEMPQICLKDKEFLSDGERQEVESTEQDEEEGMMQTCMENVECLISECEKQDMQNFEDGEPLQNSDLTPVASESPESVGSKENTNNSIESINEGVNYGKNINGDSMNEGEKEDSLETSETLELKAETGRRKRKESKAFPCDKCGRISHSSANFKKHMMTHTGERPYVCHLCHKTFRQRHHLADHWRVHSGERPFKCEMCDSRFIQKSSLNMHKKRHSGVKAFSCSECSYATYEKVHLMAHMRTHTGEKPYQCEECGQAFSTATRLKYHRMIHTGERRYKCGECGVPFREKVTLQTHMAVHLKLGPFECEECGQEFPRLASLSLHRKVHNNKDNYLYVHDKEANQCFRSAMEKASHDKTPQVTQPSQPSEETLRHESDWEAESGGTDAPSPHGTPEQPAVKYAEQGTPATPPRHPLSPASCISPEANSPLLSKISSSPETDSQHRLKENLASNLKYSFEASGSDVDPAQVREALENGTVLETQGDDGKGFFIVLPPALKNKDIMVLADSHSHPQLTFQTPFLKDRDSAFEGNLSPNILSENVLEGHGALYPGVGMVEEVHECDMDSVGLEEEICSEVEGEMIHPCEAESIECIFNTNCQEEVLEPLGGYSEAVEEHLSPDGTSLMLWKDNSTNQLGNVTYIIDAGKKEPIIIHTQDEGCVPDLTGLVSSAKGKRQRAKGSRQVLKEREGSSLELGECVKIRISSRKARIKKQRSQKVYTCEHCGKPCKSSSNYIAHLRTHSGERPYFCALCWMGFKQISHLRSHIRVHTGERPYVCNLCDAAFTQSSRLNSHKRNVHADGHTQVKKKKEKEKCTPGSKIKNFFCQHCNKTYIGECLKVEHMKTHRHLPQYVCETCSMRFKNKTSLLSHAAKHSDGRQVCEVCGVEVASLQDLARHTAMEHNRSLASGDPVDMYINVKIGEESDFIVLNPAVKDSVGGGVEVQLKSEGVAEADAESGLCEVKQEVIHLTDMDGTVKSEVEVMSTQVKVKEEEVAVHDITHTSPLKDKHHSDQQQQQQQEEEEEEEESSGLLTDSAREAPGSDEDEEDTAKEREMKDKPFITYIDEVGKKVWLCKVCDRSFGQSSNLYCHLRMHTGDKPYHCSVCPRAFRQISHLKDHMRRHTGAKPHRCSRCGKCFTQRSAVRRHIRVLHNGDAVALRDPESGLTKEVIDTLREECGLLSQDVEEGNALATSTHTLLQEEDNQNISYACKLCQKQFSQASSLNAHTKRCRKSLKLVPAEDTCCVCAKSFSSATQLLSHQEACSLMQHDHDLKNKTETTPRSAEKCVSDLKKSHCKNNGDTESKKSRHKLVKRASVNSNNLVTQNQFKCKDCGEVLQGMASYKAHLQAHSEELQQVCVMCGEAFKRASALRYHQSMKHGREDRRYKDFCSTMQEGNTEEDIVKVKIETDSEESLTLTEEDEMEEGSDREPNTRVKPRKIFLMRKSKRDLKSTTRDTLRSVSGTTRRDSENDKEVNENSTDNLDSNSYVCSACGMAFSRSSKLRHHTAMWCRGRRGTRLNAKRRPLHAEKSPVKVSKVDRTPENHRSKGTAASPAACATPESVSEPLVSERDSDVPAATARVKERSVKLSSDVLHCDTCDTCFPDTEARNKHVCSQASEKPFRCEHCLLRFRRKAHLFNHYRRHAREAL
ncbi:LOW QUALITY PROTEIN: uncharacterized protein LOC123507821 [Portunus trituberculatus]|uniref:LOW QUALITY PROTEIN: uncharacterized protein LOC123507821 n=1 Tax=Portunus trituberculatus TaxID=210409 RepID=UPI001E1CEB04|nr:LOW QUALITY PROTEIN: uncharacterized protein LOC123507821 [Portunus trituberculatus]